jgi:hypothetical protein
MDHRLCGDDPTTKRRCTATTRDGTQCAHSPIPGATVCRWHGGLQPLIQANAKKRLASFIEPALLVLNEAMEKADWPVAVRAALGLLDRAGLGPQSSVTITDDARPDLEIMTDEALEKRAATVLAMMKDRRAQAAAVAREVEAQRLMDLTKDSAQSQVDELERMNDVGSNGPSSVH